jgi:hypothetical protein
MAVHDHADGEGRGDAPSRSGDPVTRSATRAAEQEAVRRALRTPRSAAVAGIAFSILLTVAVVLIRVSVPDDPNDTGVWVPDGSRRDAVLLALWLVPFAGIAFLWFIGVVRDLVGEAEDRFYATVFLGSGLLFIAMLFASAAVAAGLVASAEANSRSLVESGAWEMGRHLTHDLLVVYAMRMAAVFTLVTSTILLRTGTGPRWLAASGYLIALLMLLTAGFVAWIELLFPAWLLALSLHILAVGFRRDRAGARGVPRPG